MDSLNKICILCKSKDVKNDKNVKNDISYISDVSDVINIDVPEFEQIDKRWFYNIIPKYMYVVHCLLYGKAITREVLIFSYKNLKFTIFFDYLFEYDVKQEQKLKHLSVDNIETIISIDHKIPYNKLVEYDKLKIETLVYQYISIYFI